MSNTSVTHNGITEYHIDIYKLEQECAKQAQLFYDAGVELAEADYQVEASKNMLDELQAQLYTDICNDPEKFKLKKITETSISNCIKLQKKYQKAQQELRDNEYNRNLLKAKRDAIAQRGSLLKEEVSLWVSNYYGDVEETKIADAVRRKRKAKDNAKKEKK